MNPRFAVIVLTLALTSSTVGPVAVPQAASTTVPRATLTAAPPLLLPGTVDSNSPLVWDLDDDNAGSSR